MKVNTLLVDGESLLKQGYHGSKQIQMKHGSVGTIYHFINILRRFYSEHGITKIVVFWEGENSKQYRQGYYPYYKSNRNVKVTQDELHDLERQRLRVKQYLEELFIRQVEVIGCEADDSIAYYVKHSPNEHKLICTRDRDLLALIDDDTKVYLLDKKIVINKDNFKNYFSYHYKNVGLIKMIAGDSADNISGIENVGEVKVLKLFPELLNEPKTSEWIVERVDKLLEETPTNSALISIKEGKTKWGIYGTDYFSVMEKVINLETPNITDELIASIEEVVNDCLSPEGRGGVNAVIELMKEDEIISLLPKFDDSFFVFWSSFLTIVNKETKQYEQFKKNQS